MPLAVRPSRMLTPFHRAARRSRSALWPVPHHCPERPEPSDRCVGRARRGARLSLLVVEVAERHVGVTRRRADPVRRRFRRSDTMADDDEFARAAAGRHVILRGFVRADGCFALSILETGQGSLSAQCIRRWQRGDTCSGYRANVGRRTPRYFFVSGGDPPRADWYVRLSAVAAARRGLQFESVSTFSTRRFGCGGTGLS